ncbi:MAG TPA: FAD-dependent oxidoreductase [Polyangiaceae bacterium]|nr:FAD-dependent oxidoreductase [Polyangiaceae bacterium]
MSSDVNRPAAGPPPTALARPHAPGGWRGKTRIVVLGGGFAGAYAAKGLEKRLRKRSDVEVILISNENYLVFQPMLPEVISGTIGLLDVVTPLRDILRHTEMHIREVESVDTERRLVHTSAGFDNAPQVIEYDHLIVALGNVTDFRGMRGLPEHAFPFKNLADALQLRNHVIRVLDEAALAKLGSEQRARLLTFVVSGGGFSGVEVAAELNDFVRRVAGQHYPGIDPKEIRVLLLHGMERILPEMPPSLADYAHRLLSARGVEIRLQAWLSAATGDAAILKSGEVIPTKTLVSTVPASPNPVVDAMTLEKTRGRIVVDEYLRSKSHPNVWALGDCATVPVIGGGFAPPTAQHATREADLVAENVASVLSGGKPRPFQFKGLGKLGSLGRQSAVAEVFGLKFSGFFAWWLWRTIYLMKMPSFWRRVKVAVSWTLDLFLPPELVQLRLEGSSGIDRQHFEPGELVFCEGDAADSLYILLEGKAEVVRGSEVVAELGPGEYFGEMALLGQGRTQRNATVRCVEPMNVLCLPKKEFGLLAAHMPGVRQSFESVAKRRATLFGLKRGGPGEVAPAMAAMGAVRAQQQAQAAAQVPALPGAAPQPAAAAPPHQLPQVTSLGGPPLPVPPPPMAPQNATVPVHHAFAHDAHEPPPAHAQAHAAQKRAPAPAPARAASPARGPSAGHAPPNGARPGLPPPLPLAPNDPAGTMPMMPRPNLPHDESPTQASAFEGDTTSRAGDASPPPLPPAGGAPTGRARRVRA